MLHRRTTVVLTLLVLAGGWMGAPQEELAALVETAKQKDPDRVDAIGRRALSALDEHTAIKEKLESTSNQTKKKRLVTLLGRKEIEFDEAFNEIAVIAGKRLGRGVFFQVRS